VKVQRQHVALRFSGVVGVSVLDTQFGIVNMNDDFLTESSKTLKLLGLGNASLEL
jgi:hypothetical protein